MTAQDQRREVHALTARLLSLSVSLRDHAADGPELVTELLRCSRVVLDLAEDAAALANRLEDDAVAEEESEVARAAE